MTYEEAYRKYFPKLVTYWRHSGKCRKADAEDIVQDTFTQLFYEWKELQSHEEPVLCSWLYHCMPFKNYDYLRSIDLDTVPLDDKGIQVQLYKRIIEESLIPDGMEENRKWKSYVKQIKKQLNSEEKELFTYRVEEQLRFAKIAEKLDISEAAAKMRWKRLRKRLYPIVKKMIEKNCK